MTNKKIAEDMRSCSNAAQFQDYMYEIKLALSVVSFISNRDDDLFLLGEKLQSIAEVNNVATTNINGIASRVLNSIKLSKLFSADFHELKEAEPYWATYGDSI